MTTSATGAVAAFGHAPGIRVVRQHARSLLSPAALCEGGNAGTRGTHSLTTIVTSHCINVKLFQ